MPKLRVQSVLFQNEVSAIRRTLDNLHRAADLAIAEGIFTSVEMVYGDCSPIPVFTDAEIEELRAAHLSYLTVNYRYFNANLGSAKGHNNLLDDAEADYILIMNPDVVVAPNTLRELKRPFEHPQVGMVEARQLPIEHPKAYDADTGETGWATTACALIPKAVFDNVGNFDSDSFFLYCDDVDFSWRVRLAGLKVIYQPSAAVFHDKRLSNEGGWMAGAAEQYYSAEAALMMSYKWSRHDITERLLKEFGASKTEYFRRAVNAFELKQRNGELPTPLDPEHTVGEFINNMYTTHRFAI